MKKLALVGFFVFFLSSSVFGQASATFQLRGTIPERINITSTISELPLIDLRVNQSMMLGSISLSSNITTGYSITITSLNGGIMRSTSVDNTETLPYSLDIGGIQGVNLQDSYSILFDSNKSAQDLSIPIVVNFPGLEELNEPLSPGVYEDIVVITVSAL